MFKRLFSARRWLALCGLVTVLILAFLAVISPQQLPVIAYKAALVSFAACIGVWIDRAIFPSARPSGYLKTDWLRNPDADGGDDEVDVVGGDDLGEDVEEVVVARCGNLGEAGARRVDDGHVGADHLEAARLELEVEAPAGGAADAGEENADHQPITPSKARTRTGSKASALAIFACCPRKAAMPATRSEPM